MKQYQVELNYKVTLIIHHEKYLFEQGKFPARGSS